MNSSEFLQGVKDCAPIMLVVTFFAMLFGATGVSNGLELHLTVLSSAVVFAGASQFVFLDLYGNQVPVWSVLIAVFAVNFRHTLYSASIGRYMGKFNPLQKFGAFCFLTDPSFAAGELRAQREGLTPSYYFGYAVPLYMIWVLFTWIGGLFGSFIENPQAWGFDMLLAIYFVSLLMGFRSRPNWLTTVLSSGIASVLIYNTLGSPWHITLGSLVGIALAACLAKPKDENTREGRAMIEYLLSAANEMNVWVLILLTGVVTLLTRCAGHVILARFKNLNPRIEAALEAIPASVLITLILPPALTKGPLEFIAIVISFAVSLYLQPIFVLGIGLGVVIAGRAMGF